MGAAPNGPAQITTNLSTPARALAISAHPDDSELQAGATLAKWAAAGCEVFIAVCTDGSKGTWDVTADTAALVARRQNEQRAAAAALGASTEVSFYNWVDGELSSDVSARAEIARLIRMIKPNVVIGHDPWKRYRLHPDHRHAGLLVVEGIVAARDPHFFPEQQVAHHRPDELLLFEADEPDHVEGVAGWLPTKIAALEAHESQMESTMFVTDADDGAERQAFHARVKDQLSDHGALAGFAEGEAFKRISDL